MRQEVRGMKRVDMKSLVVVHSGETWAHLVPPCSRAMIRFLERNEDIVTWVQVFRSWFFGGWRWVMQVCSPGTARWRTSSL